MALNPGTNPTMTGRITPPDAFYPYGSVQNESSPGAGDGTPYFKARGDDIFGFQQALLADAGIVPSGNADSAVDSQYLASANILLKHGAFKNKVVNGDFRVNQLGTSFTTTDADEWTSDQWRSVISLDGGAIDGGNGNVDILNFTLGQTDVPGNPATFMRINGHVSGGSGSEFVAMTTKIEAVETLAGELAAKTVWVRGSINGNIGYNLVQNFGTGGGESPSEIVDAQVIPVTTTWTPHSFTYEPITSVNGKTRGPNNDDNLSIGYFLQAGATFGGAVGFGAIDYAGDLEIAEIQLERGRYPTPYERLSQGDGLMRAYRYLQRIHFEWFRPIVGMGASLGQINFQNLPLKNTMRVTPTASIVDDQFGCRRLDGTPATILAPASTAVTAVGRDRYHFTWNGGTAVAFAIYSMNNNTESFNILTFDARL